MPPMTSSLVERLQTIPDPRRQSENLKHLLVDIIILGVCGVQAGCEDFVEMEEWAKFNEQFFRTFLELPHGIPSHDTFNRVFAMLSPAALQGVLVPWLLERRGVRGLQIQWAPGQPPRIPAEWAPPPGGLGQGEAGELWVAAGQLDVCRAGYLLLPANGHCGQRDDDAGVLSPAAASAVPTDVSLFTG